MDEYTYTVTWSKEDACYVAEVAEFQFLAAHGNTAEEALAEIKSVVKDVVAELHRREVK